MSLPQNGDTWYSLQTCKSLKMEHHIHFLSEKNVIIERTTTLCIKDGTNQKCFDDCFLCKKKKE